MKFTFNNITYEIRFQHQTQVVDGLGRYTYCRLINAATREVILEEDSYCHPNDNFNRETGRRLSLVRLLKQIAPTDKQFRRVTWMCYLNRCNTQVPA